MSAHSSRWARGSTGSANPQMRISDADRAEVADRLSKHYSDGRLDQAEFNERLDRAMNAKTQADLSGLFADLPTANEPEQAVKAARPPDRRPGNRHPVQRVLGLILITVVAIFVARALMWPFFGFFGFAGHLLFVPVPWILIAIVAFLCWRYATRHRRRP
ncbi:MAG TPA: DUF1707 domain-containing protein [Streptosporangiaceae bacterium]|nr:DUF1707 domain-containing protein [Streptosporangiaceae bacterium]